LYEKLINNLFFIYYMPSKIKFVCENCRFRFERPNTWREKICPFCGRNNSIHEELSVADLVDDLDNLI